MLKASDIIVDTRTLGDGEIRCVRVSEDYEYINRQKTSNFLGHKYDCVAVELGYEQIPVRIPGAKQLEPDSKKGVPVSFQNLELRQSVQVQGDYANIRLKGTATGITALGNTPSKNPPTPQTLNIVEKS